MCCLAWHPSGRQIAYTDTEGRLGLLDGLGTSNSDTTKVTSGPQHLRGAGGRSSPRSVDVRTVRTMFTGMISKLSPDSQQAAAKNPARDFDDLFDGDDDRLMDEGLSDTNSPVKKAAAVEDDDDDDFLVPATGRARNRGGILDDENSLGERREGLMGAKCWTQQVVNKEVSSAFCFLRADAGSLRLGHDKLEDDDDVGSAVGPAAAPPLPSYPVYDGPLPTPPQKAFQPGATPAHLTHRFMVRLTGRGSSGIVLFPSFASSRLNSAADVELGGNRAKLQRRAGQRHRRGVPRHGRAPRHAPHQHAGSHHG